MLILLPYKESKNTFLGTLSRVEKVLKGRGAPPASTSPPGTFHLLALPGPPERA